jgi:IS5 family transposase
LKIYEKVLNQKRADRDKIYTGIEPIIGHVKSDCGMDRNYLKGEIGDQLNAMLASSSFNFRR